MMDKDFDLDALLAEASVQRVPASPALSARILHDAALMQPKPHLLVRKSVPHTPRASFFGWLPAFADVLGGVRAVAGLSLAAMTGLFLGVAQPNLVQSLTAFGSTDSTTLDQIDLLPATGTLWTEN